jgi:long-chain acyl-CoA synthetase
MAEHGFWNLAEADPDGFFVLAPDGSRSSAGEMVGMAHRLVHGLRGHGLAEGAVVAAALSNGVELLQVALAALQAGWYFLALDSAAPPAELALALRQVGPDVLFVHHGVDAWEGRSYTVGRQGSWGQLWRHQSPERPRARKAGERLLLSSGTTGLRKVLRKPLSGLSPEYLGKRAALHLSAVCGLAPRSGAIHLVASPLHHSASLLWCLDQLQLGHSVVLMEGRGWAAEQALGLIERYGVTASLMVPTHFRRLLDLPEEVRQGYDVSSLRQVVHTGAPCPPTLKRRMLEWWGAVLYEVYGAAEGPGTRVGPREWLQHPGTVGKAHGRVRVVRRDGTPCPPGEVGRVLLRLGARGGEDGFASVGDLGYLDSQDYLYLRGREDDVILTGGVKVHPVEVEAALAAHPLVRDAAVLGLPHEEWGEQTVALIEPWPLGPGAAEDLIASLREHCRKTLAAQNRPRRYLIVSDLPRDAQGKLRRRLLPALMKDALELSSRSAPADAPPRAGGG